MLTLAYGRGSQRITCPHYDEAVPSGPVTITILDDQGNTILASTSATKGALSTTTSAAASAGATTVVLTAITGLAVGDAFTLSEDGEAELVVAQRVDAAGVTLRDPLSRSWSSGATAKSAQIYYDASLTDTDDYPVGLYYQARFDCTTWKASRSLVFRVVQMSTENPITYEHMRNVLSHLAALRDSYDSPSLEGPRSLAWEVITAKLLAQGYDPAVLKDPERLAVAGGMLAAALFCLGRPNGGEMAADLAGQPIGSGGLFGEYFKAISEIPHWYDRSQDGIRGEHETRVPRKKPLRYGR